MEKKKWKPWKTNEIRFLNENHETMSVEQMAKELGRRSVSVYSKLKDLGLRNKGEPKKRWTEEEDKRLLEAVENFIDWERVAKHVGRSTNACQIRSSKRNMLGRFIFWTDDRKEELLTLRRSGWGYKRLAKHFGRSYQTVYRAVERYE